MAPPRGKCSSSEKLESWLGSKSSSAAMHSISLLTAPPFPRFWGEHTHTLVALHEVRAILLCWEIQGHGQFAEALAMRTIVQDLYT